MSKLIYSNSEFVTVKTVGLWMKTHRVIKASYPFSHHHYHHLITLTKIWFEKKNKFDYKRRKFFLNNFK